MNALTNTISSIDFERSLLYGGPKKWNFGSIAKKSNDNNRGTSQLDKKGFSVNYKSRKPYYPPECSYWPIDKK